MQSTANQQSSRLILPMFGSTSHAFSVLCLKLIHLSTVRNRVAKGDYFEGRDDSGVVSARFMEPGGNKEFRDFYLKTAEGGSGP
jgi:hypothetical protein